MRESFKVYGALVLVQLLFGLWPVAGTHALGHITPAALIGFRTLLGAPLLFLFIRQARSLPTSKDLLALAGLAFFGIAANQILYAEGLKRAGPVNAVILIVSIPVITLIVATLLGKERPGPKRLAGVAIAVAGVLYLLNAEKFDLSSGRVVGSLFILTNTTCYSIYLVFAKGTIARLGAFYTIAWVFLLGAIEAAPYTVPDTLSTIWWELPGEAWLSLLFILAGPTIGTYFLNAYALKSIDSSIVAIFIGLQPLVGCLAASLAFGTEITARIIISGLTIIMGVLLTTLRGPKLSKT